jgi:hypothetical protein
VDDHYRLLSAAVNVRTTHRGLAESLRWHLAPFRTPRAARRRFVLWLYQEENDRRAGSSVHQYARNGELKRTGSAEDLLNYTVWDLHALVPKRTRDFLLLHAGAVTMDGRAVILPAPPESGKSSLAIALLQAGFDYLSDELAAIDPFTGWIHPFPKRIWVTDGSLEHFPGLAERLQDRAGLGAGLLKRYVRPDDLDAAIGAAGRVGLVVFPTSDHHGAPRVSRLSRAQAVHRLAGNTFNLPVYGERGLERLSRIVLEAPAFQLDGGTPKERAGSIAELVAGLE